MQTFDEDFLNRAKGALAVAYDQGPFHERLNHDDLRAQCVLSARHEQVHTPGGRLCGPHLGERHFEEAVSSFSQATWQCQEPGTDCSILPLLSTFYPPSFVVFCFAMFFQLELPFMESIRCSEVKFFLRIGTTWKHTDHTFNEIRYQEKKAKKDEKKKRDHRCDVSVQTHHVIVNVCDLE